ncbi:nucleoside phosphorylase [uncultured Microscilla sp.]|uniref:nucleoside phosphorylase n=1 Tax=uncultured Microscilla sp. TaxID=432653 RepID=UPI00261F6673|nr:nucleoside phosphorylase [uncultured Microscilla sp.]
MQPIPSSELILSPNGSIYHLHLLPEQIADTILTVGDPNRVEMVSRYFDKIELRIQKREFVTHTGLLNGKRVTVISSGMGTDNIEILMTELDALVNIDLKTRTPKPSTRSLSIIRLGTSGALQQDIPLDSLLVSEYGIGLDTLMCFYNLPQTENEAAIGQKLQQNLELPFTPYAVACDTNLKNQFAFDMLPGNTLTCPGFYAPQGRKLRLSPKNSEYIEKLVNFNHNNFKLTNFEMETSGYYAMAKLLGHKILSINAIIASRINHQFSANPQKVIERMIETVLERV